MKSTIQPLGSFANLLLFHYRECPKTEKFIRLPLHPILDRFWSYLHSINKVPSAQPQQQQQLSQMLQPQMYSQQSVNGYWAAPSALVHTNQQMMFPAPQYQPMMSSQPQPVHPLFYNPAVPNMIPMSQGVMHNVPMQQQHQAVEQMQYVQSSQVYRQPQPVAYLEPLSARSETTPVSQQSNYNASAANPATSDEFFDDLELDLDKLSDFEMMDFLRDMKQEDSQEKMMVDQKQRVDEVCILHQSGYCCAY